MNDLDKDLEKSFKRESIIMECFLWGLVILTGLTVILFILGN